MATVDSKTLVDQIIAGGGWATPEDRHDWEVEGASDAAPVDKIVQYTNYEGRTAYGLVFAYDGGSFRDRYEEETAYVRSPTVIWRRDGAAHTS